ncbi:MAG TPA: FAD-dependent oxidoreductase, partial [Nevskiaceae bacterium]|nr:FAD-dependent oxidoreductase [Nevskiaceae bacterium]
LEPAVRCAGALLSPSTGIVDSHAFLLALLGEAEAAGATLVTRTTVARLVRDGTGFDVLFGSEPAPLLRAGLVVNCAGADAPALAARTDGLAPPHVPKAWYAKGHYFALQGPRPFGRLIYPVPEPGGLGVHFTLDLAGSGRFGPDVEWVETPDVAVDPSRRARFEQAIREWWPGLPVGALVPAYAGVRPKIAGPSEPAADFRIDGPEVHGIPSLVNLFGIESPGLTASLAIADEVLARLRPG